MAQDLDLACNALGSHVKAEFDARRKAEEKKLNPESGGGKSRHKTARKWRPVGEVRIDELWTEVVSEIIEGKLVFHVDGADKREQGQPPVRWRVVKPVTGDPKIDESASKGERTTFDQHGRRRAAWDSSGRRVFFWKPAGA